MCNLCSSNNQKQKIGVRQGFNKNYFSKIISESTSSFEFLNHERQLCNLHCLQQECVCDFCHDNKCSRLDSNSKWLVNVCRNGTIVKHPGLFWGASTGTENHASFKVVVKAYLDSNQNLKIPSESTFRKHTCKCVINPSTQRCVDIIQSKLFHYLRAIDRAISSDSHLKLEL